MEGVKLHVREKALAQKFANGGQMRNSGKMIGQKSPADTLAAAIAFHKDVIENTGPGNRPSKRNVGIIA